MTSRSADVRSPIAIVGIGCRFPGGVTDVASYWRLLCEGVSAISETPKSRFDLDRYYDEQPATPGRVMTRWGGYLEHLEEMDAAFFGLSPREAERLDPAQRLLLEGAWEAFEDAGQDVSKLAGSKTGVFVGQWLSDFESRLFHNPEDVDFYMTTGSGRYAASGRLSYAFNLQGPSLTVDTACSSSLVAVHLACQSLHSGECEVAIAGGVNVILQPHITIAYSQSRMMAADGRCKFGDAMGDGYVRSEGVGLVVLKPLARALADGDRIYATILGSAVNNDGHSSGSLGTPSQSGQEALLRAAYNDAGISAARVGYVEAHGTGTRTGDPVEVGALGQVLQDGRAAENTAYVGSVKSNFGHTEGAAGVAGLIKVAMALHNEAIPASLHCTTPNPAIAWDVLPLAIPQKKIAWAGSERIGGVSAFGIAGTNAHVVLAAANAQVTAQKHDSPTALLVPLSARSPEALKALALRYAEVFDGSDASRAADVCANASLHRAPLEYRAAFAAEDVSGLATRLREFAAGESDAASAVGQSEETRRRRIAFVFPGQGAQWVGMARELYRDDQLFRESIVRADAAIARHASWSLTQQLHADEDSPDFRMQEISVIQPTLLAVEIALAEWWRSHGIEPDAIVGHSVGELGAAFVAGALSLDDAFAIACSRSALMQRTSGQGAMAVVELSMTDATHRLSAFGERVCVAVNNGPRSTVVSGDADAVNTFLASLEREGIFCRLIKVDVASHSAHMDSLVPELVAAHSALATHATNVPLYSTVQGARIGGEELSAAYWGRNLREPVLFGQTIDLMLADGVDTFIEMSPHPALLASIKQVGVERGSEPLALSSLRRQEPERHALLSTIGQLFAAGHEVPWRSMYSDGYTRTDLPQYPWQRERHWLDIATTPRAQRGASHGFLHTHVASSTVSGTHYWHADVGLQLQAYLSDHRVNGVAVLPAAAFLEMVLEACVELGVSAGGMLTEVTFDRALVLREDDAHEVQVAVESTVNGGFAFVISSRTRDGKNGAGEWTEHVRGIIRGDAERKQRDAKRLVRSSPVTGNSAHSEVAARGTPSANADSDSDAHYASMDARGLEYRGLFRGVREVQHNASEARASVVLPELANVNEYRTHPALLDACLQVGVALLPADTARETFVPTAVKRIEWLRAVDQRAVLTVIATDCTRSSEAQRSYEVNICVADAEGNAVLRFEGVRFTRLARATSNVASTYSVGWQPQSLDAALRVAQGKELCIVADQRGVGAQLTAALNDTSRKDSQREQSTALRLSVVSRSGTPTEAVAALTASIAISNATRFVHLWSLDAVSPDTHPSALSDAQALGCLSTLQLVQTLARKGHSADARLFLVTSGAQAVAANDRVSPEQAPLWGLGRVIANEHPELRCTLIDVSANPRDEEIALLARELMHDSDEHQVAIRGSQRFVARLSAVQLSNDAQPALRTSSANARPFQAINRTPGVLDGMALELHSRRAPNAGEVDIEIESTGLNFMNVMSALGIYPGYPNGVGPLGIECAGRIAAIGADVTGFAVGDSVFAIAMHSLGSHVVVDARLVRTKPAHWNYAQAAAFPIAYVTAHYALNELARVERGERVLIHAAAGGVGLAAVELARNSGADVFATAGTPEKRAMLEQMGVKHVMDSRSLEFREQLLDLTNGEGVDVVLNSLAGEFIGASLDTLRSHGRFVEIGKRDIYRNSRIGLAPFQRSLSYFAVDLDRMIRERPAHVSRLLDQVVALSERGAIKALPVKSYPVSQLADAFRLMAQAGHTGKIAIDMRDAAAVVSERDDALARIAKGTCVITGGLGALGLAVAERLVAHGVRSIALVGRHADERANLNAHQQQSVAALEQAGATIRMVRADVALKADVTRAFAEIEQSSSPITAVVHAAGILDDGILLQQDAARFAHVMLPKVDGAWNLHAQLASRPEVELVLFSSVASLLGNAGQGNYAAANAFLDALSTYRRQAGGRATTINWGPWSEIGLAAESAERGERLAIGGVLSISPAQGLEAFEQILAGAPAQIAVMPMDWPAFVAARPTAARDCFLAQFTSTTGTRVVSNALPARESLLAVEAGARRRNAIEAMLKEQVARVLRQSTNRIDASRSFRTMGLDSLMGLELRNRLESAFAVQLPATIVFNYPTVKALAPHLAMLIGVSLDAPIAATTESASIDIAASDVDELESLLAEIERLSTGEAQAMLERDRVQEPKA